jgi:hypothetical protein
MAKEPPYSITHQWQGLTCRQVGKQSTSFEVAKRARVDEAGIYAREENNENNGRKKIKKTMKENDERK